MSCGMLSGRNERFAGRLLMWNGYGECESKLSFFHCNSEGDAHIYSLALKNVNESL